MRFVRAGLRLFLLLMHVVLGILLALAKPLLSRNRWQHTVQWWLRMIIHILGGQVRITGTPLCSGALMVANHIAWLDIPLLGGYSPIRFLSKQEIENWPIIGWLANCGGTLYIERGKQGAAQLAAERISASLRSDDVVLVFPEATTSDGRDVRPFHARLFSSAMEAGVPVQPVALRYRDVQGEPCNKVPYVDKSMLDNLLGFLGERTLYMEIHYLEPIVAVEYERKALAGLAEEQVRAIVRHKKP